MFEPDPRQQSDATSEEAAAPANPYAQQPEGKRKLLGRKTKDPPPRHRARSQPAGPRPPPFGPPSDPVADRLAGASGPASSGTTGARPQLPGPMPAAAQPMTRRDARAL